MKKKVERTENEVNKEEKEDQECNAVIGRHPQNIRNKIKFNKYYDIMDDKIDNDNNFNDNSSSSNNSNCNNDINKNDIINNKKNNNNTEDNKSKNENKNENKNKTNKSVSVEMDIEIQNYTEMKKSRDENHTIKNVKFSSILELEEENKIFRKNVSVTLKQINEIEVIFSFHNIYGKMLKIFVFILFQFSFCLENS